MTNMDDEALDSLLLSLVPADFVGMASVLGEAHETIDDWSEFALAGSINRLIALEQRGVIEIDGDPRKPLECGVRRAGKSE